jgi:hypothetical protein
MHQCVILPTNLKLRMNQIDRLAEIIKTYQRHGWQLRRVLLSPESSALIGNHSETLLAGAGVQESEFDAAWFARPSHGDREAWELRLVAETPYALFEVFAADESEEQREEVRRDLEARMRDYLASG